MPLDISKGIGRTFSFLFGHIADVLKIAWLPIVLQLAAFYLLMPGYIRATAGLALAREPEEITAAQAQALPGYGLGCLIALVTLVTSVAMFVGLTRLVLTGAKPRLPFYIGWGKDEWRVAGGWLLFALIVAGLIIVLQVGRFLLGIILGPGPIALMIILALIAVLLIAIVTACARLSLLAPATLALGKIGLGESWERTDDHFWGYLGFWVLFFLMFFIVFAVIYLNFTLPPGFFGVYSGISRDPESIRAAMVKGNEMMIASYDFSNMGNALRHLPGALFGPIASIIICIAGAMAWKLTTESEGMEG